MTEPEAGSAVTDLKTTATPDGEGYRINGAKVFPNSVRRQYLVYVRFGPGVGGIGSVLIDTNAPGFTLRQARRSSCPAKNWAQIYFDNVYVPPETCC